MARRSAGRFDARPIASINMTPMVPVLLAVFAVLFIAGVAPTKALLIEAPGCSLGIDDRRLVDSWVSVEGGGRFRFNNERVSVSHLSEHLRALGQESGARLLLRAEPEVPYGEVADVLNAAKAQGLSVSFIPEDLS